MWNKFRSAFVLRPMIIFALLPGFSLMPDLCWAQGIPDNILPFLQPSGNLLEGVLLSLIFFAIAIAMPLCSFLIEAEEQACFSISLTALCAGVYSLSATGFGPFLLTLPILWHYLAMISLFLLPVGICKFLNTFCPEASAKFYLLYFEKGHTTFALLSLIAVTTGLVPVTIPLKIFLLLLIITHTVFFFILLNSARIGKENTEIIISGLLIFLASCVLAGLNKVFGDIIPLDLSTIWGLLGLIICLILSLKNNVQKQHRQTNPPALNNSPPSQSAHEPSYQSETVAWNTALLSFIHDINTPLGTGILTNSHLATEVQELYELFRSDEIKKSDLETHLLSYKE